MRLLPRILTRALTHAQPDAKAPLRAPSIKHAPIPKKPKGPGKAPYARAETHTCWLIDLENVGKAWTEILDKAKPGDTVAVFWSNQAAEWSLYYWNLSQIPDIRFMFPQCETGTHNALDFQLTAWLGRMSVLDPDARFVIVSGDRGYRPLRDFLGKRGIPVAFFDPKAETIKETPAKIPAILSNPIPKTKTAQIPSVEEVRKALAAAGAKVTRPPDPQ